MNMPTVCMGMIVVECPLRGTCLKHKKKVSDTYKAIRCAYNFEIGECINYENENEK